MRIEQVVAEPCAMCTLVTQRERLTMWEKVIYGNHLRLKHRMRPYYVER